MKTLYFDCAAGASGDMILGALVGAGADPDQLIDQLKLLGVENYQVSFSQVDRCNLSATRATVETGQEHSHRHLNDLLKIIDDSHLNTAVKDRASHIFSLLAEAEAEVHNVPVERIHFHEVGALDAIIDVVGACIGFELLGIKRFVCSPLHVGSGTVEIAHGRFPVPPPAVVSLLRGAPIYSTEVKGELVTPTGAAIIKAVTQEFGPLPPMVVSSIGYGAGSREYKDFPNALRVIVGETADKVAEAVEDVERLVMLETNIDDMSPQVFGYLMERAFELGALDCYFTPVQMKKNRPGTLVSILSKPAQQKMLCEMLLVETTTLGVRTYEVERLALQRAIVTVETPFGAIDIKEARIDGRVLRVMPEYEQCRKAAREAGVSLREVEQSAIEAHAQL
ncbi:MAG: nickel pincer cofactor biosynthesis protein LarC [Pyrinomonadaceae bacterium]